MEVREMNGDGELELELFSVCELASAAGVHRSTIWRFAKKNPSLVMRYSKYCLITVHPSLIDEMREKSKKREMRKRLREVPRFRARELARLLGISRTTVYRWLKSGKLQRDDTSLIPIPKEKLAELLLAKRNEDELIVIPKTTLAKILGISRSYIHLILPKGKVSMTVRQLLSIISSPPTKTAAETLKMHLCQLPPTTPTATQTTGMPKQIHQNFTSTHTPT